jgi:hypothetical protein
MNPLQHLGQDIEHSQPSYSCYERYGPRIPCNIWDNVLYTTNHLLVLTIGRTRNPLQHLGQDNNIHNPLQHLWPNCKVAKHIMIFYPQCDRRETETPLQHLGQGRDSTENTQIQNKNVFGEYAKSILPYSPCTSAVCYYVLCCCVVSK